MATKSPAGNGVAVGILANPASGRDIRRLVARASVFHIAEKCNMIVRMLFALGSVGVERAYMMADRDGIAGRVQKNFAETIPQLAFLDIPVEGGPVDTLRAVESMVKLGVRAIVVLGGDGTHRLVAKVCGDTPITALSTGTNNVFPRVCETTVAGLATGLVAMDQVRLSDSVFRNKILCVELNGIQRDVALVDVAITHDLWIGARAVWNPQNLAHAFCSFGEPDAIGLSSVAGLLCPVDRTASGGLRLDFAPSCSATHTVLAPIAPGLIVPVGVERVQEIAFGERQTIGISQGVIALDGEREIEFGPNDHVTVHLERDGPFTIAIERVMARAAQDGLLVSSRKLVECQEALTYATQQK
jgi:predicted polyphosphate/ATP-dependent NAD kinase